jgi:hypothetical protein
MKKRESRRRMGRPQQGESAARVRSDLIGILQRRFPSADPALIGKYGSVLFPLLVLQGKKGDEPDYSKPGEVGKRADPHLIYVWRSTGGANGEWEEIVAREFDDCDNIVIEVALRLIDKPCPPKGGFASLVKRAVQEARRLGESPPCPNDCRGTFVDVSYKKWYCEEDDVVVVVQVYRMCNVV